MAPHLVLSLISALSILAVWAKPVERRQNASPAVDEYIYQVKTVIYVIDSIKEGNSSASCADLDLPSKLDAEGYDGDYAQQLLCEAAVGIQIFSDLDQAATSMAATLSGLNSLRNPSTGPSRLTSCQDINVATLNEAGLDGTEVQNTVCRAAEPATESSSSTPAIESTTTVPTAPSFTPTNPPTLQPIPVFSNTGATRSGFPAPPSSLSPAVPKNQSNATTATIPSATTVLSISVIPISANVSRSPESSTGSVIGTVLATAISTDVIASAPVESVNHTSTASVVLRITPAPTAISANVSSVVAAGTSALFSNTTITTPTSMETTESTISVTTPTFFWTTFSPTASSISPKSTGDVLTVTDFTTTTEIVWVTKTITAQSTTQVSASMSTKRGPWQWTGTWQSLKPTGGYGRPPLFVTTGTSKPSGSAVTTGGSPYGNPNRPVYGSPSLETESCLEGY